MTHTSLITMHFIKRQVGNNRPLDGDDTWRKAKSKYSDNLGYIRILVLHLNLKMV